MVDVSLKDRKEKPIRNLSSYYLFLDLPDGTYTVQVRSDYYFDDKYLFSIGAEFEDDLNNGIISDELRDKFKTDGFPISETARVTKEKEEGKLNIYANITLKPKPSYPFPPGATVIRGKVYDSAGKAISGAKVRLKGKDVD